MTRHPLTATLERATNASEALRALLLCGPPALDHAAIHRALWAFADHLRAEQWRDPAVGRAALRLASAVESPRDNVLE